MTGRDRLVSRFTSEAQVRSQTRPYEVCGGRSSTGTGVSLEYLALSPIGMMTLVLHTDSFLYPEYVTVS